MIDHAVTHMDIEAFIDKELDAKEEKRVLEFLEQDVTRREMYRKVFRQKLLLKEWWTGKV